MKLKRDSNYASIRLFDRRVTSRVSLGSGWTREFQGMHVGRVSVSGMADLILSLRCLIIRVAFNIR